MILHAMLTTSFPCSWSASFLPVKEKRGEMQIVLIAPIILA
jgi:hypothetical protein